MPQTIEQGGWSLISVLFKTHIQQGCQNGSKRKLQKHQRNSVWFSATAQMSFPYQFYTQCMHQGKMLQTRPKRKISSHKIILLQAKKMSKMF